LLPGGMGSGIAAPLGLPLRWPGSERVGKGNTVREFFNRLVARGDVAAIDREVSGKHELAAICQASQKESERALLFNNVAGTRFPVATNVFGSRARLCRLIGADDGFFCRRWTQMLAEAEGREPAPAEAVEIDTEEISLGDLPQITYQARDVGPYITAGIFLAKAPQTGVPNLSIHRAMHVDDGELRIRLGTSHDLTQYQLTAEGQGEALEAAILIGAPTSHLMASVASIPRDESEMALADKLKGSRHAMRRCRHIDLDVPAETEFVIEGRILPNVKRPEGPFGEFKGLYVEREDNHVFEVLAVTAREDAIYHGILCGSPEDMRLLELSVATQIYRHLSATLPGILDVSCAPHVMNTVVKIEQQYEGHAQAVFDEVYGVNADYSKVCIVVDEDVDINDFNDVYWACLTRASAQRDMAIVRDLPGFYRDPHKDHWGRLSIDATKPWGRQAEFERTSVPGADRIDLRAYF